MIAFLIFQFNFNMHAPVSFVKLKVKLFSLLSNVCQAFAVQCAFGEETPFHRALGRGSNHQNGNLRFSSMKGGGSLVPHTYSEK